MPGGSINLPPRAQRALVSFLVLVLVVLGVQGGLLRLPRWVRRLDVEAAVAGWWPADAGGAEEL